jgi:hypothetical protein
MFGGSLCVTDILEMAKKGHSAFSKSAKNDKVYMNVVIWQNDKPDEYGNSMSIQLSSVKEKRDVEKDKFGKGYIGNAKIIETTKPVSNNDLNDDWSANVPTRQTNATEFSDEPPVGEPISDLPF